MTPLWDIHAVRWLIWLGFLCGLGIGTMIGTLIKQP
jgi:hypothetical protein